MTPKPGQWAAGFPIFPTEDGCQRRTLRLWKLQAVAQGSLPPPSLPHKFSQPRDFLGLRTVVSSKDLKSISVFHRRVSLWALDPHSSGKCPSRRGEGLEFGHAGTLTTCCVKRPVEALLQSYYCPVTSSSCA